MLDLEGQTSDLEHEAYHVRPIWTVPPSPCLSPLLLLQASATQRAGRTARVRPGRVYRLYPRELYSGLPEHGVSEIHRQPLAHTLLSLRSIVGAGDRMTELLAESPEPPLDSHVLSALQTLMSFGMLVLPSSGDLDVAPLSRYSQSRNHAITQSRQESDVVVWTR